MIKLDGPLACVIGAMRLSSRENEQLGMAVGSNSWDRDHISVFTLHYIRLPQISLHHMIHETPCTYCSKYQPLAGLRRSGMIRLQRCHHGNVPLSIPFLLSFESFYWTTE